MSEELQAKTGVGGQPVAPKGADQAPTAPPTPATASGQAPAPTEAAAEKTKIDLTALDEFRAYQASADRRLEEARKQALAAQQKAEALERQMQEAKAATLPLDQRAEYYKGELETIRAQAIAQQREQEAARTWTTKAEAELAKYGLDLTTPGLDTSGGPTAEGFAQLMASVLPVVLARNEGNKQQTQAAARDAQVAAINATGATQVDLSVPGTLVPENPIANITDATELMKMGFQAMKKK